MLSKITIIFILIIIINNSTSHSPGRKQKQHSNWVFLGGCNKGVLFKRCRGKCIRSKGITRVTCNTLRLISAVMTSKPPGREPREYIARPHLSFSFQSTASAPHWPRSTGHEKSRGNTDIVSTASQGRYHGGKECRVYL